MPASSNSLAALPDKPIVDWLQAARHGSREAMGNLLEACRPYLLLVANRELAADLRAKGGASDVVQDTFLDGHRNFGRFNGDTEAELLAWLRGILVNNLAMFERRYRRTAKRKVACERSLESLVRRSDGEVPVAAATLSPSGCAVEREEAKALEQALARLPLDCGRIIVLLHRENLSLAEAAGAMNRSIDAARRLWARAVELLADELDRTHGCR
jgi:RNA polymerase sigma-70 factor, ECF subfamily